MSELIWPKGVKQRNNRIQIAFSYEGEECRELLPANVVINQRSIKYAENKLHSIKAEIAEGRFHYREHFPDSPKALKFEGANTSDINRTVFDGVDMWLDLIKESKAPSTIEGYTSKAKHVKDYFGKKRIRTLKKLDIIRFRKHLIETLELDIKTVSDIFTPLRGAFDLAKEDGIIKDDILTRIKNLKADDDKEHEADPYTEKELAKIEALKDQDYYRPQALNMFIFTCWTGLSFSEAMAVAWEDVDLNDWTIKVQRARVANQFKVPKEAVRTRTIDLLPKAIDILKEQKLRTYMMPAVECDVLRRNNVTSNKQSLRFIFLNEAPEAEDGLWKKKSVQDAYRMILKKAKVRHRGANQCRHTFASMLLTKYVPIDLVSTLLGHSSTETTRKHYARIIPQDRPNMAKLICGIMGISDEFDRIESEKQA